jgi:hypothetical protein
MLGFKKYILAKKLSEKWRFYRTNTARFMQKMTITLVFKKNATFHLGTHNGQKSPKI